MNLNQELGSSGEDLDAKTNQLAEQDYIDSAFPIIDNIGRRVSYDLVYLSS